MALIEKTTGEYHKIVFNDDDDSLNINYVWVDIYENEEHRIDGNSIFKKHYSKSILLENINIIEILCKFTFLKELSIIDNYKTAIYNYIKTLTIYKSFNDN